MADSGEDLQAVHAEVKESVLGGSVALAGGCGKNRFLEKY
jgi:hypothetical protein